MAINDRPSCRLLTPKPRTTRARSPLPKSRNHLSWEEAIDRIERSQEHQSSLLGKITSIQRRIQSWRPPSRARTASPQSALYHPTHQRARSTPSLPQALDSLYYTYDSNQHHRPEVEIARCLPPHDRPDSWYITAELANSLPPNHLESPPGYCQPFSPSQQVPSAQKSRSVVLQFRTDELFLDLHRTSPSRPRPRSHPQTQTQTHLQSRPYPRAIVITPQSPPRLSLKSPDVFELEHCLKWNDLGPR